MARTKSYDRNAALDAALSLFWRKGYHATSLKDLEAALDMKPGSIYAAFKSKENLYKLTLAHYFDCQHTLFSQEVTQAASPLAALVEKIRQIGEAEEDDPRRWTCMLIKTVVSATDENQALAEIARGFRANMEREMVAAFDSAKTLGELSENVDTGYLAHRYQRDIMILQVDAQMGLDPHSYASQVERTAQSYERMRVSR